MPSFHAAASSSSADLHRSTATAARSRGFIELCSIDAPSRIYNEQIGDLVLIKGLSSRKVGATSIHLESSQSHIVFTCVIESWCKDEGCLENTDEELLIKVPGSAYSGAINRVTRTDKHDESANA